MHTPKLPSPTLFDGAAVLPHTGVVRAEGPDAAAFLHGQMSQDVTSQPPSQARLGGLCSPKGRLLADFLILHPAPDTRWLLTDAEILPSTLKRLSMFVLRAKLKLTDATQSLSAVGLAGPSGHAFVGEQAAAAGPWSVSEHSATGGLLVRLPDVQAVPRWLWVGPAGQALAVADALPLMPIERWQWLAVMSAIPWITGATVDQFVPQMVNYELVGGVNFQKGCYPGQEIVARSQYRGTLKRRAFLMHAPAAMQPGQEVYSAADPGQPAGMVVTAAPLPGPEGAASGWFSGLVELKWQLLDQGLRLGVPDGPALAVADMPYDVPRGESANS